MEAECKVKLTKVRFIFRNQYTCIFTSAIHRNLFGIDYIRYRPNATREDVEIAFEKMSSEQRKVMIIYRFNVSTC